MFLVAEIGLPHAVQELRRGLLGVPVVLVSPGEIFPLFNQPSMVPAFEYFSFC